MNRFFLYAVAIAALCSACETDTARAKYETASRLCAQSYINCVTK